MDCNGWHRGRRTGRKRIVCLLLAGAMAVCQPLAVSATSKQEAEKEKQEAQEKLNAANRDARQAEANRNAAEGEVTSLSDELTVLLAEISLLESDLEAKEGQIQQAQADYDAAKLREEQQYEDMKKRIRYMYEKGDTEFLDVLLRVKSMSELLNKSEYIENIYSYDRQKLEEYQETKQQVMEYQETLENEKAEMEAMQMEYQGQKSSLENTIAEKRRQIANFDAQLAEAQAAAAVYTETISKKNAQIRQIEEEERRRQEEERRRQEEEARRQQEAAAQAQQGGASSGADPSSGPVSTSGSSGSGPSAPSGKSGKNTVTKSSGGTAAGRAVADYALQFLGNPYVYGGTSLTNGADCSGFVQSVYKHFGMNLPRTSYEQQSVGTAVDFQNAQAGDIICYAGHVGIYIGGGQIVHASNSRTGIITSPATYRSIMTVRRVLD